MELPFGEKANTALIVIWLAVSLFFAGTYVANVVKLVKCDWSTSGSWKGEIVHAIGLVPGASVITVWNNDK